MREYRCGGCGHKHLERRNMIGRDFYYKSKILILTSDFYLLTCRKCDNFITLKGETKELDKLLKKDFDEHNVSLKHYLAKQDYRKKLKAD